MIHTSTRKIIKYSAIYFICTAILIYIAALHHLTTIQNTNIKNTRAHETLNIQLGKHTIQKSFEGIISDLNYLVEHSE